MLPIYLSVFEHYIHEAAFQYIWHSFQSFQVALFHLEAVPSCFIWKRIGLGGTAGI